MADNILYTYIALARERFPFFMVHYNASSKSYEIKFKPRTTDKDIADLDVYIGELVHKGIWEIDEMYRQIKEDGGNVSC